MYFCQKYLPAIRNLFLQAKSWYTVSEKNFSKALITNDKEEENGNSLHELITFARSSVPNKIKIIIFYHPSTLIDNKGIMVNLDENRGSNFHSISLENNVVFIDTTSDFLDLYKTRHILGHGFINTKVGVGHLNKYGHEIIAKRLVDVIKGLDKEKEYGIK